MFGAKRYITLCYVIYGVSYFKDNLTSITLILTKIMKINKLKMNEVGVNTVDFN